MQPKPKTQSKLWLYIPLWLFFVYLYVQILGFNQGNETGLLVSGMYFILFGIHEAAHLVFMFLPPILTAAAGSVSEVLFASLLAFAAFRAKAYFAGIFGLLWLHLALVSMGNYMSDARAQIMPLIGPGSDPKHDWHFVFSELGMLQADTAIGGFLKFIGGIIGALALTLGLLLIISIIRTKNESLAVANKR